MSIRVALHHVSHYRFDRTVALMPHEIRLKPAAHTRTPVLAYSLHIEPATHFINWQQDPYGNFVARLVFPEPARELTVTVDLVADMTVINPFDFFLEPYAEQFPFDYPGELKKELAPYLETEPQGSRFDAWVRELRPASPVPSIIDFLVSVNQRVQREVAYLVRMEPGVQTPEATLKLASGSCRDSAWLLAQLLRHLGLATRFASGYLIQLAPDVVALDGPPGPSRDFTDLHAWCEVYVPGAGWIGLDPTSGLLAGEGHLPLACTAVPSTAAAVIGSTEPCASTLDFTMTIERIAESPRVTKPYTEAQWQAVLALGERVDVDLFARDVRLTHGGEPTFVSIDDMNGEEWNTAALSPKKRQLAGELHRRLAKRFASHPLLHFGQGKWYPGEPLPRWALGVYWRIDGVPLWRDPALIADAGAHGDSDSRHALHFIGLLATRLGVDRGYIVSAFEDPWQVLGEEQRLAETVDPLKADLTDSLERQRLARLLTSGLDRAAGYVLPIKAAPPAAHSGSARRAVRWISSLWPLRGGRFYAVPGDSPLGLRLPLERIPWKLLPTMSGAPRADPLDKESLPAGALAEAAAAAPPPAANPDPLEVLHTALCVEERGGTLHVFMPPVQEFDGYTQLLSHVEAVAARLGRPVAIEGYTPPVDPRLRSFSVTPDPGVIEVNVHPASSWRELADVTQALYEEARLTRLGTEKFMLDGRHSGTGGGNHMTLGGATAGDSPLLRRPDLLKSLIIYWQNHPALSYVFSGQFIGPTSQSPRVDEARDDNLYELDIAFQQLDLNLARLAEGAVPERSLLDRLLRNQLVDLTGNRHRAEFSIDKLYSAEPGARALGVVEFRAFEMPPHARMSLAQMLLLRALVSRFWQQPYAGRLVAWGTELHDRWLLPYYLERDMDDVVRELVSFGYAFEPAWFAPFVEFRFPQLGRAVFEDISIELRQAMEPWNVLGEEISAVGTARYVDSSVERLQVSVTGMTGGRHRVTCNGRLLPLQPTGTQGHFVAGVKYKAWAPDSALHPTIGVQAPLVFDLVDTWSDRALGGCTYHVSHPGGRNYESFPVNANEAEARRRARFWAHGHTAGPLDVRPEPNNPHFPHTLDLRWKPR